MNYDYSSPLAISTRVDYWALATINSPENPLPRNQHRIINCFTYIPYNRPFKGQSLSGFLSTTRFCGLTIPEPIYTPRFTVSKLPAITVHISHPTNPTLYLEHTMCDKVEIVNDNSTLGAVPIECPVCGTTGSSGAICPGCGNGTTSL